MKENLTLTTSSFRRKYNFVVILYLLIMFVGAIPLGFTEKLVGFYKIYFIIYLSLMLVWIIVLCVLFPYIRKKEIEFFKFKYSLDYLNTIKLKLGKEDYIFYDNVELEFTSEGLKNLTTHEKISYNALKITAYYVCDYAGEMYKVFVDFENETDVFTFKFDERLYIIINKFNIKVENLKSVLSDCELNIKNFLKKRKVKK